MADDPVRENVARLRELFPEAWTQDGLDFDVLRQLLGDEVVETEERFGLNWHGKRRARQLALTPSMGTLRPCPEDSVDWETTQNLMIEGDNLEVLKLLQKSYAGRVKLIYIDPPYNTGSDFVYPDDFRDSIGNYRRLVGDVGTDDFKLSSNRETSGRFHTDWLSMIYPRLLVARRLLRDDGVIFVSIGDDELGNLRLVMDEVFGSENLAAVIAWKKRSSPDARDTIGSIHDHILCYVKRNDCMKAAIGKMPLKEERIEAYSNPDDDPRGPWASVDMTGMTGRATAEQYFSVTLPSGRTIGPPEGRSWGLAPATFAELRADNRIWFGVDGDSVPRIKRFLGESTGQVVPSFWDMADVGSNDEAKKEVNELMERTDVFDTPKPVRLIRRMLQVAAPSLGDSIVLDFFAGSGSTAQAVWAENAKDNGDRRVILVQLPYPLDPERREQRTAAQFCDTHRKPRNASELTKERMRRAGRALSTAERPADLDTGFRVLRLASSNIRAWHPRPDDLEAALADAVEHIERGRTSADVLFELILKLGFDLCAPIDERVFAGKTVFRVADGALFACLDPVISRENVEALAGGILEWQAAQPERGEVTCVFRDNAFADDVAKANLAAILMQHGLVNVRSI